MKNEVRLEKGALDYFRSLARNTPNEVLAYLVGDVVSPELTIVRYFAYTKQYADSDPWTVCWFTTDYDKMQAEADRLGKRVVGFIHSHPQWDAVMSPDDYKIMIKDGYRVCGIVSTHGRKTRARFWTADSALPCTIVYGET